MQKAQLYLSGRKDECKFVLSKTLDIFHEMICLLDMQENLLDVADKFTIIARIKVKGTILQGVFR